MGSRYQATAVRRAPLRDVQDCVESWLARRGFERAPEPSLLPVDDARERGVYYFSNPDWTIVVYSEPEEEKRLVRELSSLEPPLLHVWLVASDVWGYVLRRDGRTIAEFDSNPDYLHADSGEPFLDEPELGDLRTGAPAALREVLGLDVSERELAALQRRRAVFKDSAVSAFCTRLGIGPAANSFVYLERADVEEDIGDGWDVTCVRYEKEPADTEGVDVHSASAFAAPEAAPSPHRPRWGNPLAPEVPAGLPASLRVMAAGARVVMFPLYLLGLLFSAVWTVRGWVGMRPAIARRRPARLPGHPPPPRRDGEWLVNDVHRCRVKLPAGVEAIDPGTAPSRGGIWSVFAVQLDAETTLTCDAQPLGDMRQISPYGTAIEDESLLLGGFKARRRVLETRSDQQLLRRELYVIQMPRAFYVWELRDLHDASRRARFESLVESFAPAEANG